MKSLVSVVLLLLAMAVSAENIPGRVDDVMLQTDTLESAHESVDAKKEEDKPSYAERRGMISRDAVKTVFIPKGQWMVGGQIAWNQWNNDNLNYLVLKDINFEGFVI